MSKGRTFSFSERDFLDCANNSSLGCISANVKLLLKLIQDHNEASNKDEDNRRPQRITGMITILDDVKSQIKKSQTSLAKKSQFRRCNTELRLNHFDREKKSSDPMEEENERLRKELYTSVAAQKKLEKMFHSLGREKEIMAGELARQAHEMKDLELHLDDLKTQNQKLLSKVQACATQHEDKVEVAKTDDATCNIILQERNKVLSEQLLKSLQGCRQLKHKLKDAKEENEGMKEKMAEMADDVEAGLNHIHGVLQRMENDGEEKEVTATEMEEEFSSLERMFKGIEKKVKGEKHERGGDCGIMMGERAMDKTSSHLIKT